jgi:hypothetical protein
MYDEDYKKVKTPKELYELIISDLEWNKMVGALYIDKPHQAAMRIRAENLSLDLPPVPSSDEILDIQNWCIEAQKVMEGEKPKKLAETEQQKQADAEKTVIEVLGNYEIENGNKKGMPLAELEQETERSWIELLSVLNSLGKKQLIEIHKGEGYVPYWLPVELDESPQLRGINANVWRFRLTSAGYELLKRETAEKPAGKRGNATPAKGWGIWAWVKRIPRWIYVLVIFLAALLGIFEKFGCLESVKAFIRNILQPK